MKIIIFLICMGFTFLSLSAHITVQEVRDQLSVLDRRSNDAPRLSGYLNFLKRIVTNNFAYTDTEIVNELEQVITTRIRPLVHKQRIMMIKLFEEMNQDDYKVLSKSLSVYKNYLDSLAQDIDLLTLSELVSRLRNQGQHKHKIIAKGNPTNKKRLSARQRIEQMKNANKSGNVLQKDSSKVLRGKNKTQDIASQKASKQNNAFQSVHGTRIKKILNLLFMLYGGPFYFVLKALGRL